MLSVLLLFFNSVLFPPALSLSPPISVPFRLPADFPVLNEHEPALIIGQRNYLSFLSLLSRSPITSF